jgi:hypothetical protein
MMDSSVIGTWLARGSKAKGGPFKNFFDQVMEKLGQAGVVAEASVHKMDPKYWLTYGPGRYVAPEWREARNEEAEQQAALQQALLAEQQQQTKLTVNAEMYMAALKELRSAGVDLNSLVDAGAISLNPAALASQPSSPGLPAPAPVQTASVVSDDGSDDYDVYDDTSPDVAGTNYAENGHWNSVNRSLPQKYNPKAPA